LNPGRGEIFHTCPDWPQDPYSLLYYGYWSFTGRGMMSTNPHLAAGLKKGYGCTSTNVLAFIAFYRV